MKGALIFIMLLSACGYKNTQLDLNDNSSNKILDSSVLDYQTIRTQVFQNYCFECHSQEGGNEGDANFETYANTFPNIATIKTKVENGSMPKRRPPLPIKIKQILLEWIAFGAPEFASGGALNPNPNNPGNPTPVTPNPDPCEDEKQEDDYLISRRRRGHDDCNKINL